jgi:cellulose synthase operon protein C
MTKRRVPASRIARAIVLVLLPLIAIAGCSSPEQTAQKHYESGMALIEKKDDLEARKELLKAVKYKSDKVEVWRALAGIDERTKATSLVLDLRRIIELDPNDLDTRLRLARIMVGSGAAEAALRVVDAAKEERPSAALHALRAQILLRTNDSAGAIREAERAFEIDPGNVDAVSLLASKKLAEGDPDGALKLLVSITPDPKDEIQILLQKLQIYARKGNLKETENLLRKVISLNPKETAYQAQLIQLLISQRRFDEAEKEFRSKIAANQSDSKAVLDLVRFLNLVKGPEVARSELEARIKAGGDVFDFQMALAELDFIQNKMADAVQALQTLVNTASAPDRKLAALVKLAEMYVSKAKITDAEPLIAEIIAKDRRNAAALRLRAAINIDKGQIDSAISDLREALNDQPKSTEHLMLLAAAYERGGKNELADRQFVDALKASGSNPNVALRYVAFLQRRGDAARAEEILIEVSNRNPADLQVLSSLAQIQLSRQNWAGALTLADTIGRLNDGRALADQVRASALAGQNKIEESISALEDARKAAPNALQPVVSLASAYVRQGRPEKAVLLLQEINKQYPTNAQVLVLLGQTRIAQKKDEEASQSFKEAVARQPKDPMGYIALADLYIRQKKYDAAGNTLQAALKEIPENVNTRLSYASLQILKGDHNAAIAQYEAILKDQPTSLVAINNLVSLVLDYRTDKASLDRAFALSDALKNSSVPQFQDTLGWAQYRRGDFKDAVATLEGALAKAPDLAAIRYHLGMSYAAVGQPDRSIEELKKALALEPEGTALKATIGAALK